MNKKATGMRASRIIETGLRTLKDGRNRYNIKDKSDRCEYFKDNNDSVGEAFMDIYNE